MLIAPCTLVFVDLDIQRKRNVVPDQLETRVRQKMGNVVLRPREEVVRAQDVASRGKQPFAQVRSQKTRPPGHEHALTGAVTSHACAEIEEIGVSPNYRFRITCTAAAPRPNW